MKLLQGIQLSFNLQKIVQGRIVRGYRIKHENELPSALNGFLYSILKSTKSQRRGILNSLLKQFDDTSVRMINKKTVKEEKKNRWFLSHLSVLYFQKNPLSKMLYLADNLAYIPYTVLDEPLFVIHHVDIMISVAGSNLLETFKKVIKKAP